ncbi:MAG: hypothetical protein K2X97_19780 [Mycobacteriaceae bacterium]|nr:hypothetical protein [Mycobacteriaceae bacterium]
MTADHVYDRDAALSTLDAFFATADQLQRQDPTTMTPSELLLYAKANKRLEQTASIIQRNLIKSWVRATPEELRGELPGVLAEALRISHADAEQRIGEAMGAA